MTEHEVLKTLQECVKEVIPEFQVSDITMDSDIKLDLKLDSFQMIGIASQIEESFGIEIMNEKLKEVESVGDLVHLIQELQS